MNKESFAILNNLREVRAINKIEQIRQNSSYFVLLSTFILKTQRNG